MCGALRRRYARVNKREASFETLHFLEFFDGCFYAAVCEMLTVLAWQVENVSVRSTPGALLIVHYILALTKSTGTLALFSLGFGTFTPCLSPIPSPHSRRGICFFLGGGGLILEVNISEYGLIGLWMDRWCADRGAVSGGDRCMQAFPSIYPYLDRFS